MATLKGEGGNVLSNLQWSRGRHGPETGSRSRAELRGLGHPLNHETRRCSSAAELLPPVELRGVRAFRQPPALERSTSIPDSIGASSQASTVARVQAVPTSAAAMARMQAVPTSAAIAAAAALSPPRFTASSDTDGTESDGDVSQFTASSCSTVRGIGYARSGSSRGSARGPILGRRSRPLRSRRRDTAANEDRVCCPRGHELVHSERHKPWFCHGCGRISSSAQMECFRCNRCNYNLCDKCFNDQVSDGSPGSELMPRRTSSSFAPSVAQSIPASIDEFLARQDDGTLPSIPPAFSRQLSPSPGTSTANSSATNWRPCNSLTSTGTSWRSGPGDKRGKSRSYSPPPSQGSMYSHSRRSSWSSVGSSATRVRRGSHVDPLLRIVSLTEWISESGILRQALANADEPLSAETQVAVAQDIADIVVRGFSYGSSGHAASRRFLDRERMDQLQAMSRCRSLPLEDVQEDLKIWHLTLLKRPLRKKYECQYGRVVRRFKDGFDSDPDLLARMYANSEDDSALLSRGKSANFTGEDFTHSSSGGLAQRSLPSKGGTGAGTYGGGGLSPFSGSDTGGSRWGATDWPPTAGAGQSGRFGGTPTALDGSPVGGDVGRGRSRDDLGTHGSVGKDSSKTGGSAQGGEGGEGGPQEDGKKKPETGVVDPSRSGTSGATTGDGKDTSGSSRRQQHSSDARKADRKANAGKDAITKADSGAEPKIKEKSAEEKRKEEDEELLASGALFRVKQVIAQAILDEFATALLPPQPLKRPATGQLPGLDDSRPGSRADTEAARDGSPPLSSEGRRRRRSGQRAMLPSVGSPGIPSRLAEDFRKCLEEAFYFIDFPEEAKRKTQVDDFIIPDLAQDEEDDHAVQSLLSRSNTVANLKSDPALLQNHLQMQAKKHGKRLQSHAVIAALGKDSWPRRLKGCQQSLRSISALDAFAEMRARENLATP